MITIYDNLAERTYQYDNAEDMREGLREHFHESVYDEIDLLADEISANDYDHLADREAYLGITVEEC